MRRTASAWENPHCLCKLYFSHLKALSHSRSVWQKQGGMISSKLHLLLPPLTVHLKYWYVLLVISTCTRSGGGKGCNFSPYSIFFRCLCQQRVLSEPFICAAFQRICQLLFSFLFLVQTKQASALHQSLTDEFRTLSLPGWRHLPIYFIWLNRRYYRERWV